MPCNDKDFSKLWEQKRLEGYSWCYICKEFKKIDEFYKNKSNRYGINPSCKECERERNRLRRLNDDFKKKHKEYVKYNREKILIYRRKWRKNIEVRNKELEYERYYRSTEKGRNVHISANHKRDAKKSELINDLTYAEWQKTLEYFRDTTNMVHCSYCGKVLKVNDIHQDHVIPLSKGGGYTKSNIVPVCKSCNSSKSNKDLEEFFYQKEEFTLKNYNLILSFINGANKNV